MLNIRYSKAYMDEALAQAKIEISPASKLWEPQRAYDKRLSASLAKSGGR
jgi:cohesin complex subunit SA-1/2